MMMSVSSCRTSSAVQNGNADLCNDKDSHAIIAWSWKSVDKFSRCRSPQLDQANICNYTLIMDQNAELVGSGDCWEPFNAVKLKSFRSVVCFKQGLSLTWLNLEEQWECVQILGCPDPEVTSEF
jgi:hypothetical protein